ncbi:MAG: PAS domain S-box protein [Bacteroidetes bacterium]|jgi:PAS domain S-box-containing protein|nr:PAS domain S-box protein [Bacteroidota bacterium]
MTSNQKKDTLRQKAENIIKQRGKMDINWYSKNLEELIEELQIYQVELEHQNIELQHISAKLEDAKARFMELYDQAPAGYTTINENYSIFEINNTLAHLLGHTKHDLINSSFTSFIEPRSQDSFYFHCNDVFNTPGISFSTDITLKVENAEYFMKVRSIADYFIDEVNLHARMVLMDITKEKLQEKELRESEEKFRRMFDDSALGIFNTTFNGKFLRANHSLAAMFKYDSPEEMIHSINDIRAELYVDPADRDRMIISLNESHDKKLHFETRFYRKDGSILYCNLHYRKVYEQTIKDYIIEGFLEDITKRKQSEKELLRSENLLNDSQHIAKIGGWEYEPQKRKINWTRETFLIHAWDKNTEPTLAQWIGLFNKKYQSVLKKAVQEALDFHKPFNIDVELHRKDTAVIRTSIIGKPIVENNKVERLMGTIQDITEKKIRQDQLSQSKEKLKLHNLISNAFITQKKSDFYVKVLSVVRKEFRSDFGYFGYIDTRGVLVCPSMTHEIWDQCEMPGKSIEFPPDSWSGLWGESLKQKKTLIKNEKLLVPEGHIQLSNAIAGVILYNNELIGQITLGNRKGGYQPEHIENLEELCNYIAPLLISKRKEELYEQNLIRAKEKAEENDNLKSAFLANMSHELRTPMNGIIGFSEMFMSEDISDEKRKQFATIVIDSSQRLLNIVNDILDISRIETGQLELSEDQVDLAKIFEDLKKFYTPLVRDKGLQLIMNNQLVADENLVYMDETKLHQVLNNLLSNALKFTNNGFIKVDCRIIDKNNLEFQVEDTGIGIAEEQHDLVFERFRQVETDLQKQFSGTGLGLAISKKMVELMNGEIWLTSTVAKGTTFGFTLPYKPLHSVNLRKHEKTTVSEHNDRQIIKDINYKILVAEDEQINFMYIKEALSDTKLEILHARNGREAVKMFRQNKDIRLVLMDIKMPLEDGFEATKKIKKLNTDIPVIAQTAYAMAYDREKALAAGCDDYLAKPIKKQHLIQLLVHYLINKSP